MRNKFFRGEVFLMKSEVSLFYEKKIKDSKFCLRKLVFFFTSEFDRDNFFYPKNMKRNFSTIILVFLLGLVIGFAFYMSSPKSWFSKPMDTAQTQQEKDNSSNKNLAVTQQVSQTVSEWQDYHDPSFGFSLKLPKNFTVSPLSDNSYYYAQPDDLGICANQNDNISCPLSIKIVYNPKELSLEKYYKVPEKTHEISMEEYSQLLKETVFFDPQHYQFQPGGGLAYQFKDLQAKRPTTVTLVPNKKLVYEISDSFLNEQDHDTLMKSLKFDEDQQQIISEYFSYLLVNYYSKYFMNGADTCDDNKLYRYDEFGDKKLVFESVLQQIKDKNFIETKKQHCNLALLKEKYFPGENKLIFRAGFMETDAGSFGLYSFDTKTQKISFMKINEHYPAFGVDAKLADGSKYLAIEREGKYKGKRLYLLDLVNDSSKVLLELKKGETLLGIDGFGQMEGKIELIDSHTISYEVYKGDNSEEGYDGQDHPLLETRNVKF